MASILAEATRRCIAGLACGIGSETRSRREQSRHRTSKHHLAGPFLIDPLANEFLRQFQGREDVSLKSPADEINGNFTDRTKFADPGVAEKNVNVPFQCVDHVVRIEEI